MAFSFCFLERGGGPNQILGWKVKKGKGREGKGKGNGQKWRREEGGGRREEGGGRGEGGEEEGKEKKPSLSRSFPFFLLPLGERESSNSTNERNNKELIKKKNE